MKLKNCVLTACIMMLAHPVFATNPPNPCGNHGNNCNPGDMTGEQSQHQDQNQHQSNQQDQNQSATGTGLGIGVGVGGNSTSNASGGNASAKGGNALSGSTSGATSGSLSGVQGSGNADVSTSTTIGPVGSTSSSGSLSGAAASNGDQTTQLDTSDVNLVSTDTNSSSDNTVSVDASTKSNYTAQALYLPSNPVTIPVGIAGSNVTVYYGPCGPLKAIETNAVTGTYFGLVRKHKVHLGTTDRIVPYNGAEYLERAYSDGSTRLFGHQAVRTVAVVSVAGGRSVSLGGGQTGGGWGQAGAGGSSAMQQVVNQIDLELCEAFHTKPTAPVIEFWETRVPRG